MKWMLIVLWMGSFETYYHKTLGDCDRAGLAMDSLAKMLDEESLIKSRGVKWMCIELD